MFHTPVVPTDAQCQLLSCEEQQEDQKSSCCSSPSALIGSVSNWLVSFLWSILNFLSNFIDLKYSQIVLYLADLSRERSFVIWWYSAAMSIWVLAVSTNPLRDCRVFTHDTPNTSYCSNTSTGVTRCWKFSLKEVLLRSVSRSIRINHTLVDGVHCTLTCGATNKSYWP